MGNKKLKKDLKARNLHVKKRDYESMKRVASFMLWFTVGFLFAQLIINYL